MKRSQPRRDWADARAKVEREAICRAAGEGCGTTRGCDCGDECAWACWGPLQAAHVVGREHDERATCEGCLGQGGFNTCLEPPAVPWDECRYCGGTGVTKTLYVKPESVVPLCVNHHRRYDPHTRGARDQLDLLPYLTADEKRQAFEDCDCDAFAYLHRLTGCRWVPESER